MSPEGVQEGGGLGEEAEEGESAVLGAAHQLSLVVIGKPHGCDCKDQSGTVSITSLVGRSEWRRLTGITVLVKDVVHATEGIVFCQRGISCQGPKLDTESFSNGACLEGNINPYRCLLSYW